MALSTTQYGYIIDPMVPFTDDKGKTIKNGFVRVFVAGSSTPVVTYRNFDGAANQDLIELDNSGRTKTSVIGSKGRTYKVCVYDKHHSQESPILTVDKVSVIGANITAGAGATVVTGLDGLTTKPDGFVDASVIGTDGYVALDHTLVTDDLDTDAKATAVENDRYVPLLNDDVNDPDSKITLGRLWQWVLGKIKNLSTTITAFRTGDVIPVDGPSGTAKMGKDDLLRETAQNVLAGNVAPAFLDSKDYSVGNIVSKDGRLYLFSVDHSAGAWDSSEMVSIDIDYFYRSSSPVLGQPIESSASANTLVVTPLRWINGVKYIVENTGSVSVNFYLMKKRSSNPSDVVFNTSIASGESYEFVCDSAHWFCYVNQYMTGANSIKISADTQFSALYPQFDQSSTYSAGEIITQKGTLYRFFTGHSAGSFDSSEVFSIDFDYFRQIYNNFSRSNVSVPGLQPKLQAIENVTGITYRITNTGSKLVSCYLMKKKSALFADIAVTLGDLGAGKTIKYTCNTTDQSFFFLSLYCPDAAGTSVVIETESPICTKLFQNGYTEFLKTKKYYKGNFVFHNDELFCFRSDHAIGSWDSSEVFRTNEEYITTSESILSTPHTTYGSAGSPTLTPLKWINGCTYKFTNVGSSFVNLYLMATKSVQPGDVVKNLGGLNVGASKTYTCNENEVFFYLSQYSANATEIKVEAIKVNNRNTFKSFSIIGDSYSTFQGYLPSGYGTYYRNDNSQTPALANGVADTWWYKLANSLKIALWRNDSWSGSTISNSIRPGLPSSSAMVKRIDSYFAQSKVTDPKSDLILFFGGTNDSWLENDNGSPIYSGWTESDLEKTLPAMCYCIDTLLKWNFGTQIIFILNSGLDATFTSGAQTICEHYGIPIVVLHDIDKENGHPTADGMTAISNQVMSVISSLN